MTAVLGYNNNNNNNNNFIYPDKRQVSQSTKVDRLVIIGDLIYFHDLDYVCLKPFIEALLSHTKS